MKKPRKPKPKAKPHRAPRTAVAPRRAGASAQPPARRGSLLGTAQHTLQATFTSWSGAGRAGTATRGHARDTGAVHRFTGDTPHPPSRQRHGSTPRVRAASYSHDEREMLALLILPFLLVASAIVIHQSVRTLQTYIAVIATPDAEVAPVSPRTASRLPASAAPPSATVAANPEIALLAPVATAWDVPAVGAHSATSLQARPPESSAAPSAAMEQILAQGAPMATAKHASQPAAAPQPSLGTEIALLAPAPALLPGGAATPPTLLETFEADEHGNPLVRGICTVDQTTRVASAAPANAGVAERPLNRETLGVHLAKAAESQVGAFVIYNDAYRRIAYPMGDVAPLFGVCTDVIVRAYRELGIDLQALVHKARSGKGDPNIDHRRTEVLRRFFAAHGESLPITSFPENYRPGDIVTYHRPQNQRSRAHIAIVSSVVAPSGRPMIVHNRGWGPQLEDALFVDQITGHYRYSGPPPSEQAGHVEKAAPAARRSAPPALPAVVVPASFPGVDLSASALAE